MEQFVHFMNDKQRDPRMNEILYPLYEEKRCTEIINDYELDEERKKNCKRKEKREFPVCVCKCR